jgi:hypothetical protein
MTKSPPCPRGRHPEKVHFVIFMKIDGNDHPINHEILGMDDDKKAHHRSSGCPHRLFYLILIVAA